MSQLKTNSITHVDNTGDENLILSADGTTTVPSGGKVVGYQTGLWVPDLRGGTTDGSYDYTNGQNGFWSRIGKTVNVIFRIYRVTTNTAGTGSLVIEGIPYNLDPSQGTNVSVGAARLTNVGLRSTTQSVCSQVSDSTNRLSFTEIMDDGNSYTLQMTSLYTGDTETAKSSLYANVTYMTDDTTWQPLNGATVE